MAGLNKVMLIGHLGHDPEMRYTPSGLAVATMSLATTESWKDKDTNERVERTEWHRITAFGKLAEICGEYLAKGRQAYIEGKLQTDQWEKDGVKRYSTKIIASQVIFLGGPTQDGGRPKSAPTQRGTQEPPPYYPGPGDDDIPF